MKNCVSFRCWLGQLIVYGTITQTTKTIGSESFPSPWNHIWVEYGSDGKASVYNVGDPGSSPGLGRSPGEGNGNPLQYYCLENPMDRGAWGRKQSDMTERLHLIGAQSKWSAIVWVSE